MDEQQLIVISLPINSTLITYDSCQSTPLLSSLERPEEPSIPILPSEHVCLGSTLIITTTGKLTMIQRIRP
jgi:hypothetical protein